MEDQLRAYRESQAKKYQREHHAGAPSQQTSETTTATVPDLSRETSSTSTSSSRSSLLNTESPSLARNLTRSPSSASQPANSTTTTGHGEEDRRGIESDMEFARQLQEAELQRHASSRVEDDSSSPEESLANAPNSSRQSQEDLDAIIAQQLQELEARGDAPDSIDELVESIASRHRQSMDTPSLSLNDMEDADEDDGISSSDEQPSVETSSSSPHNFLLNLLQRHLGIHQQAVNQSLFGSEFSPFFSHQQHATNHQTVHDLFHSMFGTHRSFGRPHQSAEFHFSPTPMHFELLLSNGLPGFMQFWQNQSDDNVIRIFNQQTGQIEEYPNTYEGLLALAERMGQVKPPGASKEEMDALPVTILTDLPPANELQCPICLADFEKTQELIILPQCTHKFHKGCILEWLKTNRTCPICRVDMNRPSNSSRGSNPDQVPTTHHESMYS